MLRSLEQTIPAQELPKQIDGLIVLGDAFHATLSAAYGHPQLGEDAERVTEMIALARQHPQARIIYSGGAGSLIGEATPQTGALRAFLSRLGVNPSTVLVDDRSRNTHENALFGKALAQPKPGETWVLITSAFHLPRAYGTFRKAGWHVTPYPVSYRVQPTFAWAERGHHYAELAMREWVGIVAYKLTGRL